METKIKKRRDRVWVTDEVYRELISEFKVTGQTVTNSLKLFTESDLGKKIRLAAIAKMEAINTGNKKTVSEFDEITID